MSSSCCDVVKADLLWEGRRFRREGMLVQFWTGFLRMKDLKKVKRWSLFFSLEMVWGDCLLGKADARVRPDHCTVHCSESLKHGTVMIQDKVAMRATSWFAPSSILSPPSPGSIRGALSISMPYILWPRAGRKPKLGQTHAASFQFHSQEDYHQVIYWLKFIYINRHVTQRLGKKFYNLHPSAALSSLFRDKRPQFFLSFFPRNFPTGVLFFFLLRSAQADFVSCNHRTLTDIIIDGCFCREVTSWFSEKYKCCCLSLFSLWLEFILSLPPSPPPSLLLPSFFLLVSCLFILNHDINQYSVFKQINSGVCPHTPSFMDLHIWGTDLSKGIYNSFVRVTT